MVGRKSSHIAVNNQKKNRHEVLQDYTSNNERDNNFAVTPQIPKQINANIDAA